VPKIGLTSEHNVILVGYESWVDIRTLGVSAGVPKSLKGILQLWKDECVFKMGHM